MEEWRWKGREETKVSKDKRDVFLDVKRKEGDMVDEERTIHLLPVPVGQTNFLPFKVLCKN